MEPLVSIIIPVYNLEQYVSYCLQSVCAQTYQNWEAVCVDDGSKDDSYAILCTAAEKDARFRVFHQENAGVSAARNHAMREAKGEYVTFLDGDDVLHPQAIELFIKAVQSESFDIIIANYCRINDYRESMPTIQSAMCKAISYSVFVSEYSELVRSACMKLYRKDVALRAEFPTKYLIGEDTNYVYRVFSTGVRLGVLDVPLYGYYTRENSACRDGYSEKSVLWVLSLHEACDFLRDSGNEALFGLAMKTMYQTLFDVRMSMFYNRDAKVVCRQSGKSYLPLWKRNKTFSMVLKLGYILCYRFPFLYKAVRICIDPTLIDYFKQQKKKKRERLHD